MAVRTTCWASAGLTLALIMGCGGKRDTGPAVPTNPIAPLSTLSVSQVALTTTQTTARIGAEVVAAVFSLVNTQGPDNLNLLSVTFQSSGTIDESLLLGGARLVRDVDGNGALTPGVDSVIASVPSSATTFPSNNSPVTLPVGTQTTIAFGAAPQQFLLLVETAPLGLGSTAFVGSTVQLFVGSAADVVVQDSAGNAGAVAGTFPSIPSPPGHQVQLQMNDHLLITEICTTPNAAEFIEIFNATANPIDLSNCYLTDATVPGVLPAGRFYWLLPSGAGFESSNNDDFTVQFPVTVLQPGQFFVVAVDGVAFATTFGFLPDAALRNANGAQPMRQPTGAAPVTALTNQLADTAEAVFLFVWDGTSNLVQDHDQVNWGTATAAGVNKTGQGLGGSTYNPETPVLGQSAVGTPPGVASPPNAISRLDYTEGSEATTGGNGVPRVGGAQHDETSEPVNTTFGSPVQATPGAP